MVVNQNGLQDGEKESVGVIRPRFDGVASGSLGTLFETERGPLRVGSKPAFCSNVLLKALENSTLENRLEILEQQVLKERS